MVERGRRPGARPSAQPGAHHVVGAGRQPHRGPLGRPRRPVPREAPPLPLRVETLQWRAFSTVKR